MLVLVLVLPAWQNIFFVLCTWNSATSKCVTPGSGTGSNWGSSTSEGSGSGTGEGSGSDSSDF